MALFRSSSRCVECGAEIRLRSFRAAPLRCRNCDKVPHDTFGCLGLGVAGAAVFGLVGFGIARVLAPLVQMPFFAWQFTIVAVFDGIGLAGLIYWRSRPHAGTYGPLYALLLFSAIAARASRGLGSRLVLTWTISNGIVGLSLAWLLLYRKSAKTSPNGDSGRQETDARTDSSRTGFID